MVIFHGDFWDQFDHDLRPGRMEMGYGVRICIYAEIAKDLRVSSHYNWDMNFKNNSSGI